MDAQTVQQGEALASALGGSVLHGNDAMWIDFTWGVHAQAFKFVLRSDQPWTLTCEPAHPLHRRFMLELRRPQGADGRYARTLGRLRRTGHAEFDGGVFVTTGMSRRTYRQVFGRVEARRAALDLAHRGLRFVAEEKRFRAIAATPELPTAEALKDTVRDLSQLAEALQQLLPALHQEPGGWLDGWLAMAWGLTAVGWPAFWRPVQAWPWLVAVALAVAVQPLLEAAMVFYNRGIGDFRLTREADGSVWWLFALMRGLPVASLLVFGLNGLGTAHQPVSVAVRSVGKLSVEVDAWRPGEPSLTFLVGGHADRFRPGQVLDLDVGRGRWGFDYVREGGVELVDTSKLRHPTQP